MTLVDGAARPGTAPDLFRRLQVSRVDRLTDDAVALTLAVPPRLAADFRFRPGQHVTVRRSVAGQELRRTYSVCASAAGGPLRIAVKRLPGGALSTWLTDEVAPGDELDVLPPAGRFGPRPDPARCRRYGLVAAGSGITPVLSIAATVLDVEPASSVVLLYGNRTSRDVMFLEELADLKDRSPARLQVVHVLSREEQAAALLSGRLDQDRVARLLETLVPADTVDEWYLCGPFGVVTGARAALAAAGVPAGRVHAELFFADPPPPRPVVAQSASGRTTVTAELHGRTTTVVTDRETSVLDAVLAVRPDAPYACRGGVCGTCRAWVTRGTVEMAVNYALEPDEVAAGVVLTCQARAATDVLAVAFL